MMRKQYVENGRGLKRWIVATLVALMFAGIARESAFSAESESLWVESKGREPVVKLMLPSFQPVVERLSPAVVNISTEGQETVTSPFQLPPPGRGFSGPAPDQENQMSPFDFFFQVPPEMNGRRSFKTQSLGSGFVIHPDGYIVTNNHVVERATKIVVTFKDNKKTYDAKVIGRDKKTDLALLKVDAGEKLESVVFGDSDELQPGDWVIAIGNPFRLGHTVTVGVVSAKSRKVPGGGPYDDFIQTDASINPGNSGGPLFNIRGEVVGVNAAIFSPSRFGSSGFNIGIGFATPINLVKGIISQLHQHGSVTRGWLGVLIQPVSPDIADAFKLDSAKGALVADVMPESPAQLAGIKRGDVIIEYDGREVQENDQLPLMVAGTEIGRKVEVKLIREGKMKTVEVTIKKLEEKEEDASPGEPEEMQLGLQVQDISPEIATSLSLSDTKGVVVTNVAPNSAAENAGLARGDVILEVSSKTIESLKDFRKAVKGLQKNKPLLMLVRRKENTIFLTLKIE